MSNTFRNIILYRNLFFRVIICLNVTTHWVLGSFWIMKDVRCPVSLSAYLAARFLGLWVCVGGLLPVLAHLPFPTKYNTKSNVKPVIKRCFIIPVISQKTLF